MSPEERGESVRGIEVRGGVSPSFIIGHKLLTSDTNYVHNWVN